MVSVLVAVYNAELFLDDCLNSLEAQSLRDIEILCVDDRSTDGSMAILRTHAERDPRIRIFQTPRNSGQAVARNIALKNATGDIITFLDADDWMATDALQTVKNILDSDAEADAVLYNVLFATPTADGFSMKPYDMPPFASITGLEAARRSISWEGVHGWFALRAPLYKAFPYDTTCHSYSDDITSTFQFLRARKVVTSTANYYYRQNPDSVTHKPTIRRFDILRAKDQLARKLRHEDVPDEFHSRAAEQVWRWLIDCCMYDYQYGHMLAPQDRAYGLAEIRRVWQTADRLLVDKRLTHKFGYCHLRFWPLFRLQNWTYFTLRKLLK